MEEGGLGGPPLVLLYLFSTLADELRKTGWAGLRISAQANGNKGVKNIFQICDWHLGLTLNRVVGGEVLACPDAARGRLRRGIAPEAVRGGESEGQERGGAQIEAAGGDVRFAEVRLMATESDGEPSAIERAGRFERLANHRRKRAPHADAVEQRDLREQLESAASISNRSPHRGVRPVGRDQAFLNRG